MKILLVTESYWPNADGGALFERRLALGLAERGHQLSIWAPGPSFKSYDETDGPTLIHRERGVTLLPNPRYKVSFFPLLKARSMLTRERPDVVHLHNGYWMGLFTLLWAKQLRIPVVATNHFMPENLTMNLTLPGLLERPLHRLTWSYLVTFHNRANYVTAPTPTAVKLLVDRGLHVPSVAITNGVDAETFVPHEPDAVLAAKLGINLDQPVILYVGRLDGEKRVDLLITALSHMPAANRVQLVLAGKGTAVDDLKSQAKALNLTSHVIFTGFIDEADKPGLYNLATLFAIASPAELQSIVMLEAMASGLPVVAVDVAALSELCHDGKNGFLFPRDDAKTCASKMSAIVSDSALAKEFGHESRRIVEASHSTKRMEDGYETVLKRVLRAHPLTARSTS